MAKVNSERNYYPHAIVGMILCLILACAWTVKIAVSNPVEMDSFYMEKYQKVDQNINQILELQAQFDARFDLTYSTERFSLGNNSMTIKLADKSGHAISNATITMLISRPDSNKENKTLSPSKIENGFYTFGPFDIQKEGRWQVMTKIDVDSYKAFHKTEAYAVK